MKILRIEEIWQSLRREPSAAQRRVDADHPLDLYADYEPPDRFGLVLFCPTRPPELQSLRAVRIERRQRQDGRWSLQVLLNEPKLIAVFAELCRDIIDFTRSGVEPERAGNVVLTRIERWRALFLADSAGLDRSAVRGLIGELLVLENQIIPALGPDVGVSAWTGPLGMNQDFVLPSGRRIEVKTIEQDADKVIINGLGQLDGGGDLLRLTVVRLVETGSGAPDALTAPLLIERLRARLADSPAALLSFNTLLRFAGWEDTNAGVPVSVRLVRIDEHEVGPLFPRLITTTVPMGVVEATYKIILPAPETSE